MAFRSSILPLLFKVLPISPKVTPKIERISRRCPFAPSSPRAARDDAVISGRSFKTFIGLLNVESRCLSFICERFNLLVFFDGRVDDNRHADTPFKPPQGPRVVQ